MTKTTPPKDPQAERESSKYQNPVASRELIMEILTSSQGPMSHFALCQHLVLEAEDQIEALRRRLIAMERDGQLISNRRGAYACVSKLDLVRGRVQGHRDGYGFVVPSGGGEDIYLTNRQMRKVFDGDEVLVRLGQTDFRGRTEGSVVEVLHSQTKKLVGRLHAERGIYFVRADNPRIFQDILVAPQDIGGATQGQLVTAEILDHPFASKFPTGKIVEVLGEHLAPGMEIDVAIRSHAIPYQWPLAVEAEARQLSPHVLENDKTARIDLRQLPLVTIDGEDARDFDDAVYCERKKTGGWRLYVAIADVSHYVAVDSTLDAEAIVRGNSVYFPDYVVPMLPEALSNGLCSLNPQVDRLCMVCEMTISAKGRITGYTFYEAIMHSKARLTYTQVGYILADKAKKGSEIRATFSPVVPHLDELHNLYQALRGERTLRGAIDFETTETRILFNEHRKIERIVPVVRNDAHKLIEECMLAANVCAAKFLEDHNIPALYRVHESPKERKLELLKDFLGELGLGLRSYEDVTPADYQAVMERIVGRPDAHLIQTVLLRSMNQAIYGPDNKGHFGLAYKAYTHFTSPIRRYPDLLTHRAIRSIIRSSLPSKKVRRHPAANMISQELIYPYDMAKILTLGEQCSLTERRADEATRDVVSWLKCEYLQDRVGEIFSGVVSAVVGFGLFVELTDLFVEGLIHISALPQDYYHHQPAQHRLVGERSGKTFRLGDALQVRVVRVSLDERKVDFELESQGASRKAPKGSAGTPARAPEPPKKSAKRQKAGKVKPLAEAGSRHKNAAQQEPPLAKGARQKPRKAKRKDKNLASTVVAQPVSKAPAPQPQPVAVAAPVAKPRKRKINKVEAAPTPAPTAPKAKPAAAKQSAPKPAAPAKGSAPKPAVTSPASAPKPKVGTKAAAAKPSTAVPKPITAAKGALSKPAVSAKGAKPKAATAPKAAPKPAKTTAVKAQKAVKAAKVAKAKPAKPQTPSAPRAKSVKPAKKPSTTPATKKR